MTPTEIIKLIGADEIIPKDRVLAWMQEKDIEILGAVYELTAKAWNRIQPELTMEEQCNFMLGYLLGCIRNNIQDGEWCHSGFEAAWEFASWFKHLSTMPGAESNLVTAVRELTSLYRDGDSDLRNRIGTGVLEHVFEVKRLRQYFQEWQSDPVLKEEFEISAAWGNAHRKKR
jgi:hypothetical protein